MRFFRQWFRNTSILLVACALLAGCRLSDEPEKTFTIGFSQRTEADTWRRTMQADMHRELSFNPDVTFAMKDANGNNNAQITQINEFVKQPVDLLIVSPNAAQPITPAVEKAYQQGIPVVILDRRTASGQYTAYVGADNAEVGRTAGNYANTLLNGTGNVVEIGESPGSSADIDRHRGFVDAIGKHSGIHLRTRLAGDWDKHSFGTQLERLLREPTKIQLIFAQNDRTALKAYRVCQRLGLEKQVAIIGVDGLPGPDEGIDLVNRGILRATVLYPTGGKEAIQTALAILHKQPFKRENRLPITLVDSSNVRTMMLQNRKIQEQQTDIDRQNQRITDLNQTYTTQRNMLLVTLAVLLVSLLLGGWALYQYQSKQLAYKALERQHGEIREQRDTIEQVSKQAREATEDKLRFYAYISHEFNTPLSLILAPTDDLLNRKNASSMEVRNGLLLVQKNAHRLVRLVDQMLDLRKADAGKLRLRASEQDIVPFLREIVSDFQRRADKQRIDLQLTSVPTTMPVWFDTEKLDKVLFNLLSNAFKYTPRGGQIHLRLDQTDDTHVRIQVRDNGRGMTPDEQAHAFDLFYSGSQPFDLAKGIGLTLTQEFVQLHQGSIQVESAVGEGTRFTLTLPLGHAHLSAHDQTTVLTSRQPVGQLTEPTEAVEPPTLTSGTPNGTLLLVEDDDDLRNFLTEKLSPAYDVLTESTGEGGWQRALETIPDLIISDVMLQQADVAAPSGPVLNGYQLTERVKADRRTAHIPVLLLTANRQIEERIEGTKAGADAYLTKPFNLDHLRETIRTLLTNRQKWQQRFASDFTAPTGRSREDRKFVNDLTALIEQHLTDSSFGVEKLSREMGVSRVQLYRKVQALLDMNVMDYLTQIRLKRAKFLLRETGKSMADIAQETGFSSAPYFTTFFKQHSGRTPSEYRRTPVDSSTR